jgi:hypothetical protein
MTTFQLQKETQLEELVDKIDTTQRRGNTRIEEKAEIENAIEQRTYRQHEPIDPTDSTIYQLFHNRQQYEDKNDYQPKPELKVEQTATKFHIGSGIKKEEYEEYEYNAKQAETKEEQEVISVYEAIQLVQDHIGESVIRSGIEFLADDRKRISNFINCDPRGKTMLLFAQAIAKIPSGDYQVPLYN